MEEFKISKEAVKMYKTILQYIFRVHKTLEKDAAIDPSKSFELARQALELMKKSKDLMYFAIHYFDKNDLTVSHAANVSILASTLALGLGASEEELIFILAAGFLHDIGVVKLGKNIINKKPSEISEKDIEEFKAHSKLGYESIIKHTKESEKLAEIIFQHHERCDGSGYPTKNKKSKLYCESRLLSLLDVYESLIHPREHRDTLAPPMGIDEILRNQAKSFDPKLMKGLLQDISIFPFGCYVKMNSNKIGRIIATHKNNPLRPDVLIEYNSDGQKIKPEVVKLIDDHLQRIIECVPPPNFKKTD